MTNDPLVSVIMAVRNGERFLKQGLDSVCAQQYRNFEILVIDGNSTDGTATIAQSYPAVRFFQQSGHGLYNAWNEGLAAARGELIAFLDHDDLWTPNKLHLQVAQLRQQREARCVIAQVQFFLEPGCEIPRGFKSELFDAPQTGRIPGTLLARQDLFDEVGGFDANLKIAADVDWFARVKDCGARMDFLPEVLLHKRIHHSNLAGNAQVNNQELALLLKRSIERQRQGAGRKL